MCRELGGCVSDSGLLGEEKERPEAKVAEVVVVAVQMLGELARVRSQAGGSCKRLYLERTWG